MPTRAPRICASPRCPNVQPCPTHARRPWGGTSQRERTGRPGLDQATRMRILRRDCYTCQACGAGQANHVDHDLSRADGGTDDDSNLRTLCPDCHARKSGREGARAKRQGSGDASALGLITGAAETSDVIPGVRAEPRERRRVVKFRGLWLACATLLSGRVASAGLATPAIALEHQHGVNGVSRQSALPGTPRRLLDALTSTACARLSAEDAVLHAVGRHEGRPTFTAPTLGGRLPLGPDLVSTITPAGRAELAPTHWGVAQRTGADLFGLWRLTSLRPWARRATTLRAKARVGAPAWLSTGGAERAANTPASPGAEDPSACTALLEGSMAPTARVSHCWRLNYTRGPRRVRPGGEGPSKSLSARRPGPLLKPLYSPYGSGTPYRSGGR
jgi:5-methylcytosine-specific restriction protein A